MEQTTWSGSQASAVQTALKTCIDSKMVADYFDETEREVLKVLLDRANSGHALAVGKTA